VNGIHNASRSLRFSASLWPAMGFSVWGIGGRDDK
jgi:hypothetical protein